MSTISALYNNPLPKKVSNLQFLKNKTKSLQLSNTNFIPESYNDLIKLSNREHALEFSKQIVNNQVVSKVQYCKRNNISRNKLDRGLIELGIKNNSKTPKDTTSQNPSKNGTSRNISQHLATSHNNSDILANNPLDE